MSQAIRIGLVGRKAIALLVSLNVAAMGALFTLTLDLRSDLGAIDRTATEVRAELAIVRTEIELGGRFTELRLDNFP